MAHGHAPWPTATHGHRPAPREGIAHVLPLATHRRRSANEDVAARAIAHGVLHTRFTCGLASRESTTTAAAASPPSPFSAAPVPRARESSGRSSRPNCCAHLKKHTCLRPAQRWWAGESEQVRTARCLPELPVSIKRSRILCSEVALSCSRLARLGLARPAAFASNDDELPSPGKHEWRQRCRGSV